MWRNENKGKRRKEKKEVRKMEEDKNTLDLHTEVREEDRVAKAVALFKEGYNCSQSVVTAFADLYGFTREQALHMSASFGGGIGRMRETCGAACGMFLLAGLEKCAIEGKDRESKAELRSGAGTGRRIQEAERRPAVCRFAGIVRKRAGSIHTGSKDGTVLRQASLCKNGRGSGPDLERTPRKTKKIG